MIVVLSPSKTLDYTALPSVKEHTIPEFTDDSKLLINCLREKTADELANLMTISDKLAKLNYERYQDFSTPPTPKNSRQAILAFKGDVYAGIEVDNYSTEDFAFAQNHVRILSGLYGLLRPLDLIQPYRLEMGTNLPNQRGKNLYEFWGDKITTAINSALHQQKQKLLVNLASQEYFKAVRESELDGKLLNIIFKEKHGNQLKIIGLFAKQARGKMANFIIRNRIENHVEIKDFCENGYSFSDKLSDNNNYVFVRTKT